MFNELDTTYNLVDCSTIPENRRSTLNPVTDVTDVTAAEDFRWLTEDEQRTWRALLEAIQLLFDGLEQQLTRSSGISHADYEILARLSEADGRSLRMCELAEGTMFSRSRLSHAASRLERLGWLARCEHPVDGRGRIATMTDDGFRAIEAAAPGHVDFVRRAVFDALTPRQVEELRRIANRIAANLRQ